MTARRRKGRRDPVPGRESGGLPDWPPGEIELPDEVLAGLPFRQLAADLPLLLLPVRLETRFRLDADPPELRIRILPDQIHVEMGRSGDAAAAEAEATRVFWDRWQAAMDARAREAAWRALSKDVGAPRAGYLARAMRPGSRPPPEARDGPATARLLPRQWVAIGMSEDAVLFTVPGEPVAADLRTGPEPGAASWEVPDSGGLTVDERLAWMVDYDRAVEAGMAITVPLTGTAAPGTERIATLLVVGVDAETSPEAAAAQLDRVLAAHGRNEGLAFVPQGTPTNNTESARSGWSPTILEPPPAEDFLRSAVPDLVGIPDVPRPIPVPDNAARLASALGLASDATLRAAENGEGAERRASRAMLRVTYEAILGTLVRRLLRVGDVDGLSPAALLGIRAFCLAHVTGGGQQACLRIGPQPYGILPVLLPSTPGDPATPADHVGSIVALLRDQWLAAARALPRLDPNATDTAGADADLTAIGAVLATQPHPARLFTRRVDEYTEPLLSTPQWWWLTFVEDALDPDTNPNIDSPYTEIATLRSLIELDNQPQTIDDQIAIWEAVGEELPGLLEAWGVEDPDGHGPGYVESVLALLRSYEVRQRPLRWIDLAAYEGVLGETNTALVEARMSQVSTEWGADGIVQAPDAEPGQRAADYLGDLLDRFRARRVDGTLPSSNLDPDFLDRRPLLYQILDATLSETPTDAAEEAAVEAALAELASTDEGTLEWLLRECLGLGAHRLDAWATSLAAERLARIRAGRPRGLQIGGFGWVTDLTPRSGPRTSGGYVHAPSLAHATTAAVLRAGWLAHGTDDPSSTAAIDVTSERVRSASWLLDGVRAGRPLGEQLGYAFERSLHDLHADEEIRAVRRLVLDATGRPDTPPEQPVDGVVLLDLQRDGAIELTDPGAREAFARLEGLFDAVNDVGLFEAVHQLTLGSYDRATALLDALATGLRAPPELRAPQTPRAGVAVEHRVLVLLDPDTSAPGGGWSTGVRDTIAPALEAWVASLLPSPQEVALGVVGGAGDLTLSDLGLSALDAMYLVGDDVTGRTPAMRTLAAAALGVTDPVELGASESSPGVSLQEFAAAAIELRRAIDSLRVADARDLRPAHAAGEPDRDDAAPLAAADALAAELRDLVEELGTAAASGSAAPRTVERLARLGIATGTTPDDPAAPGGLLPAARGRLRAAGAVTIDPGAPRAGIEQRLAAVLAARLPMLGRFPLDEGAIDFGSAVATDEEAIDWLDAVARVRPAVGRVWGAGLLCELLAPERGLSAAAAQAPHTAGDAWVATGPSQSSRLSVCGLVGPAGPPRHGGSACGLVVDQWSEVIPRADQTTGLTFQYDAPSNRPPQAWLLALAPDGEPWSLSLVIDTVLETFDWTRMRGVAPEDLLDYGRAIPTTFVPGGIARWPVDA